MTAPRTAEPAKAGRGGTIEGVLAAPTVFPPPRPWSTGGSAWQLATGLTGRLDDQPGGQLSVRMALALVWTYLQIFTAAVYLLATPGQAGAAS